MSSLKMHIAISKKIKDKNSFGNEFLLGAILPDLYKVILKEKGLRKTHYEEIVGGLYLPNIDKFCLENVGKKTELVYGYLSHLVQDRIWFGEYMKRYVKDLHNGNYRYLKDYTIHARDEFINSIYTDYTIIDKYLVDKYKLDILQIKEELKNISQKPELIEVIDKKIIDYNYDTSKGITFFSKKDADEYFERAFNETEKVLKKFMR